MSHNFESRRRSLSAFSLLIFASTFLLAITCVMAQQPGRSDRPLTPSERVQERQMRRQAQMETSAMIDALRRESRKTGEESRPQPVSVQIKQDFEQLQTVNNRMMATTFSNNVLDYGLIAEASTEIRKRALRLKSNLPLPEGEKAEPPTALQAFEELDELDGTLVKPALLALDEMVMSFVTNPIFQHPDVIDLHQSAKARRDLEGIIKLSAKIKKSTEKLTKASK